MKSERIIGRLQNMSATAIQNMIDPFILEKIKRYDPNPLFKAYSIGHEGVSTGNAIGIGKVALRWFESAINKIVEKIKLGTKFFKGHVFGTNETAGRKPIGEVVAKTTEKINGVTNAIVVAHIDPEHRDETLDVASFEGDVILPDDLANNPVISESDVQEITGITLGNSEKEKPAFSGAVLQGALQMLDTGATGGSRNMDLKDIIKAVQDGKFSPSQIFDAEALRADETVADMIAKQKGNENLFHEKNRLISNHKIEKEAWQKEKDTMLAKINELTPKALMAETTVLKDKIITERGGISDIQKKFIDSRFANFKPSEEAKVKEELNTFLDETLKEFKSQAEIFGYKINEKDGNEKGDGKDKLNEGVGEGKKESEKMETEHGEIDTSLLP